MQAAVSVIRNSKVVCYSGAATVLNIWRYRLVHIQCSSVRYLVEVRYWECPLIESPLYTCTLHGAGVDVGGGYAP